jgi:ASCH domain
MAQAKLGALMLALTVRQPWAWAIIHAGKDVENRSWPTSYRGPLAIHAATKTDPNGPGFLSSLGFDPADDDLTLGAVIGIVDLAAVVQNRISPWAFDGYWHWVLHNPRPLPKPVRYRGQPGLFEVISVRV